MEVNPQFWLPIGSRADLPTNAGIYFVMTAENIILYIGRSANLYDRWCSHERLNTLLDAGCTRIAWRLCEYDDLAGLEQAAIEQYRPPMNKSYLGKKRNPAYTQVNLTLKDTTVRNARISLLDTDSKADLSNLMEQLLQDWIAEHPSHFHIPT